MGGGFALVLAANETRLAAVDVNYGRLITDPKVLAGFKAAFLGNFAGNDKGIPPADVRAFESQLKRHVPVDIKIYDGAGHAFMNPNNKNGFDAAAADDAWKRIDAFFAKTLKAS
jgi:carboxymethylenebutenolidase